MTIEAVLINHNTAPYAELALRSLRALNSAVPWSLTLIDNSSTEDTASLFDFVRRMGATIRQSGYSLDEPRNTHGENLARFMLENSKAEYFLLMDADICFLEEGTIGYMLAELSARPDCWGIQAKMKLFVEYLDPQWQPREPQPMYWRLVVRSGDDFSVDTLENAFRATTRSYVGANQKRPHPFCLLVRNSATLQRVVSAVGLSTAFVNADLPWGGWYDTAALMARVLVSHELSWMEAHAKPVLHYAWVSERREHPDLMNAKLDDCRKRLAAYRARGHQ